MRQGNNEWLKAVVLRCSIERMFLEISKNSQENTCARVSFEILAQVFSCEFCEIFKNTFFYRAPPVAASVRQGNTQWLTNELFFELFLLLYNIKKGNPSMIQQKNLHYKSCYTK